MYNDCVARKRFELFCVNEIQCHINTNSEIIIIIVAKYKLLATFLCVGVRIFMAPEQFYDRLSIVSRCYMPS